ncbi:MAG: sulfatase-like hydrolase/transferase, partial [Acidobacteriota bacterium]|nr:sulfatase-like hydrolase/transferase [Acidobacteriota bacterium]
MHAKPPTRAMLVVQVAVFLLAASSATAQPPFQPNIIVILADDLGVETLGAYGGTSYETPELDRIAAEGMRFENGHSQPLCTPTRVKLMTGLHNYRNYREFMYLDPADV